ncbi:hypothetical protein ACOSP7_014793 [Xanthoceras sorbifolium]|uniref:Auxin-responsive protein n=1 Tax=Xanthoceras sorbifolium TaxID=99658 RepID=A0ABQ8I5S4_9ROSI|nr:hypothetical protein JRO89_XS04G0164200 [Xanthoceras sorbifolium]
MINFEETELRLGLPGGNGKGGGGDHQKTSHEAVMENIVKSSGKRGFSETVDLKLNLSTTKESSSSSSSSGLLDHEVVAVENMKEIIKSSRATTTSDPTKPPAKTQVVGWPPVRSYRKNIMAVQKNTVEENDKATTTTTTNTAAFVKVSMDGAPYLRKVDLKLYRSYQELSDALGKMFSSFTIGNCGSQGILKDFMNESKLIDLLNGSDYVPTYEDKDGDWMLVGDVPWEMFVDSCKRLRIMKGSEAIGLAPRAVEKCKNRS